MRTTLNIDDDVLAKVKEPARREKTAVGKVLSRVVRAALTGSENSGKVTYRNGVPILPSRGVIVTNELVDRIREEEGI